MGTFTSTLLWTLAGAVLGALLSVAIPAAILWQRYKRRPDILGDWKSSYQGIDEPENTWVSEDLTIRVRGRDLNIKNANSSHGYNYTAFGHVIERVYLSGNWISIRPGANAHGAFILAISAQGNFMYGYWVGPDLSGSRRYGRWVLARDASRLDDAKALLEQMRHPRGAPIH